MTTAEPAPPLLRPTLMVTLFAAALHAANFVIQMLIARLFGAGAAVDAFVAANTLPQYIVTVLIGTLPVVFIPVLSSWAEDSARVAGGVILVEVMRRWDFEEVVVSETDILDGLALELLG